MTNRISNPFHYVPDDNGDPVPFGLLYTHAAGTLDDLPSYQDEEGTPNANPVVMDAAGKATVILDGNYRLIFRDALGNLIYDVDNVSSQDLVEWINGRAATFVSSTIVTIPGDQTATYQVGRGVKINNNPALVYSTCASVSYDGGTELTTITTVDAVITSGVIDIATSVVGPDSKVTQTLINSLAASTGGGLVGVTGGGTLQAKLDALDASLDAMDYQPYDAGLDVPVDGRRTGSDGELYRALIANGPGTTVVDPVGDVSGTWEAFPPDNTTPIGTISLWPTGTPPARHLEMNGAAFSGGTYADLAVIYPGLTLTDLRGEFLRGWDNSRGVDSGRAILSAQGQAIQAHTHTTTTYENLTTPSGAVRGTNAGGATSNFVTGSTGGAETRPRNVALMFIIRAL